MSLFEAHFVLDKNKFCDIMAHMKTYAFIDASNLFYGGKKSLGWKIDYQKLLIYLKEKYGVEKALYFGGIEIHNYPYNYLTQESVSVNEIEKHLVKLLKNNENLSEGKIILIDKHLARVRFYKKLSEFGYELYLKPVKLYEQDDESTKRKANCDVDMAFYLMKEKDNFERIIILSGDGDFLPVLKYLRGIGKEVDIMSRRTRTAREIKKFAGTEFKDFEYLKNKILFEE